MIDSIAKEFNIYYKINKISFDNTPNNNTSSSGLVGSMDPYQEYTQITHSSF